MITVFKKIWKFSESEQGNIKKSIFNGVLNSIFNALQMMAIYIALVQILDKTVDKNTVFLVSGILVVSLVGKIITKYIGQLQQTHAGYFMAGNKRVAIGNKLKKVPMGFFSDYSLGKLTSMTTTILGQVEMQVPILLVIVLGGILNTLIFVLTMFFFDARIALIAVAGIIGFFIVTSIMVKRAKGNSENTQKAQMELVKQVLTTIQGMGVIKSYNLGGKNNKMLDEAIDESCSTLLKIEKAMSPYIAVQRIVIDMAIAGMVWFSIQFYLDGTMILSNAIMAMIASFIIFENIKGAGSSMAILRMTENAIDNLEYIDNMPVMKEGTNEKKIINKDIKFKNVTFKYDEKVIIDNLTCSIPKNKITAIIGPSGSGKTTLCSLIARFWDVNSGEIEIGGKNMKEYTLQNLMSNISMVFQDVYLFQDTIENNIKFGKPNASHAEVVQAAKKACCHDFIMVLPNGYDTVIGESGATISGGEKQRLSIARAILKDASIVIFDEATANIDPENEDKLRLAIESLTQNKTIIMIAHRLKTIRNADQILVLDKGKIVQKGTHDELIKEEGIYSRFINMKNKSTSWKLKN